MNICLVLGVSTFALLAASADAANFDCAKASSKIENAICASDKLSKLDSHLGEIYNTAILKNNDPDGVKIAQRSWIKQSRNACPDEACLLHAYEQRIAALKASLPKETQDAIADSEAEDAAEASEAKAETLPASGTTDAEVTTQVPSPVPASAPTVVVTIKPPEQTVASQSTGNPVPSEDSGHFKSGAAALIGLVIGVIGWIIISKIARHRGYSWTISIGGGGIVGFVILVLFASMSETLSSVKDSHDLAPSSDQSKVAQKKNSGGYKGISLGMSESNLPKDLKKNIIEYTGIHEGDYFRVTIVDKLVVGVEIIYVPDSDSPDSISKNVTLSQAIREHSLSKGNVVSIGIAKNVDGVTWGVVDITNSIGYYADGNTPKSKVTRVVYLGQSAPVLETARVNLLNEESVKALMSEANMTEVADIPKTNVPSGKGSQLKIVAHDIKADVRFVDFDSGNYPLIVAKISPQEQSWLTDIAVICQWKNKTIHAINRREMFKPGMRAGVSGNNKWDDGSEIDKSLIQLDRQAAEGPSMANESDSVPRCTMESASRVRNDDVQNAIEGERQKAQAEASKNANELNAVISRLARARAYPMDSYKQSLGIVGYTRGECTAISATALDVGSVQDLIKSWPTSQIESLVDSRISMLKQQRCLPPDFN